MNASVRWAGRNLAWLLLVVAPAIVLLSLLSTAMAGYDPATLVPGRLLGDLAVMYPALAMALAIGGVFQSLLTIAAMRFGVPRSRLAAMTLAPTAFGPLALSGALEGVSFYLIVPLVLACVLYVALVTVPPVTE